MLNPFKEVNWHPDTAARRMFGRSLMIGFPILAAFFSLTLRFKNGAWPEWPLWMGAGGVFAGLFAWLVPAAARPLYVVWYTIGCSIGLVVSNTAITAIYLFAITPVGLMLRAFGKDPMERRFEPAKNSYWKDAEKVTDPERYFRQY